MTAESAVAAPSPSSRPGPRFGPVDLNDLRSDLLAEQADLDTLVAALPDRSWATSTASPRWSVADQIAHLAWFDEAAAVAIRDPEGFAGIRDDLLAQLEDGELSVDDHTLGRARGLGADEVLAWWRRARSAFEEAAADVPDEARIAWVGPSMGARSFLTARLMETWAHGQDVVDAVGLVRPATDRLRHVAVLGVMTRDWSYRNRGLDVPPGVVLVDLVAPSGARWRHRAGRDGEVVGSVAGPAEAFCLVVTQRRHVDETALVTEGALARDWMLRAQAFAGPPTVGPPAR
jgi:uncharacterized protein (TIGR03084 family)